MATYNIVQFGAAYQPFVLSEFEEALQSSTLRYSTRHLFLAGVDEEEEIELAIQKAIEVCYLAGADINLHFKRIYAFDAHAGEMRTDWRMSKKGFNLVIVHMASLNPQIANWLWELV